LSSKLSVYIITSRVFDAYFVYGFYILIKDDRSTLRRDERKYCFQWCRGKPAQARAIRNAEGHLKITLQLAAFSTNEGETGLRRNSVKTT